MAKKSGGMSMVSNDDWQCEDDLRTLTRAKEIEADPKRMAKCQALAKQKMMQHAAVAGSAKPTMAEMKQ